MNFNFRHGLGVLLWIVFLFGTVDAAETHILGHIPGYAGQPVYILRPADYVSWDRLPVGIAVTDAKGKFEWRYDHPDTTEVLVYTPRRQWALTLVPGAEYNCLFQAGVPEPLFRGKVPPLNAELEKLQTVLRTLDATLVGYEPGSEDYASLYQELVKVQARYAKHPDAWVRTHAQYAIGYNLIEAASRLQQFDEMDAMEMALLFEAPVQLRHPEYVRFLYYSVLNRLSVPTFRHYLRDPVKDYGLPMDIMKREILWYPLELRPLILLVAFKVCYMNNWYPDRATHHKDLRALKAAIDEDQLEWQGIGQALLHRFETVLEDFPGELRFCDGGGNDLDLGDGEGKPTLVRIRMVNCEPEEWKTMQGKELEEMMRVVEIYANPSGGAYAPCNKAAYDGLMEWLDGACGVDVVLDGAGKLMRW